MAYDAEKMVQDTEEYGLFTYEDFEDLIPEIAYEVFNGDYLKVAIGKGLLTWEEIEYLAERYISPDMLRAWALVEADDVETVLQSNFLRTYRATKARQK